MTTWRMPAEWDRHERTWLAWPSAGYTLGETDADADEARRTWSQVALAVARFEPVTVVVDPSATETARAWLAAGLDGTSTHPVSLLEAPLDDAWMRDMGPSFVVGDDGRLGAVDWVFNGWGAQSWATWAKDAAIAETVAAAAAARIVGSPMVNEGGGFHVDGRGTALVTRTVQLDPGRNPQMDEAGVEEELARTLGVRTCVWLPRGLTRDYGELGTRGHVDIVACFTPTGRVLLHWQEDETHPDHAVSRQIEAVLAAAVDADGRPLEVVRIPAPVLTHDEGGQPVDWSYVNHLVCNGGIVACTFDDPNDERALAVLREAYPDREVVGVDARPLYARGGGIHCITQQQPAT